MRSAISVLLEQTTSCGHPCLQPADPCSTDLFEYPTTACPRPMRHAETVREMRETVQQRTAWSSSAQCGGTKRKIVVETARSVCVSCKNSTSNAASSLRQDSATLMCTTPRAAACSAPSSADASPEDQKKNGREKQGFQHTYHMLRWPLLRLNVLLDAAAAALDARRLQTFCEHWRLDQHLGTSTLLILSAAPL